MLLVSLYDGTGASIYALVCPSVHTFKLSETSGQIEIKFHLEHYWGGGLTSLDVGLDCHMVIMGKIL